MIPLKERPRIANSCSEYALINKWDWRNSGCVCLRFAGTEAECRAHYATLCPQSQRQVLLVYRPGHRGGTLHELTL